MLIGKLVIFYCFFKILHSANRNVGRELDSRGLLFILAPQMIDHIKSAVSETSEKLKTVEEGHSPDVAEDSHTMTDDGDGPTKEQGLQAEGGIEGRNEVTNTSGKEADDMDLEKVSLRSSAHEGKLSPHFCSKHQRWVRNILRECPESSEEQQAQASENSPSLFPSTSSSEDRSHSLRPRTSF